MALTESQSDFGLGPQQPRALEVAGGPRMRFILGILLVFIVAMGGRGAGSATAQIASPAATSGSGLRFVDKAICTIVGTASAGDAARRLIQREAGGRFGPLLADIVIATVTSQCGKIVTRATSTVQTLYRSLTRPKQPTRAQYLSTFADQSAASIGQQVRINGQPPSATYVLSSVQSLCGAIRSQRSPIPTFESYYPRATLSVLGAMNGVAALVIRRCPLNGAQATFLTSAILGHLTANQYAADRDPPIVLLGVPTETRYNNGTARVRATWNSFDFSTGVSACFVWIGFNGSWRPDSTGVYDLAQGTNFKFAIRCRDGAGNLSSWSIGTTYTA